MKKGSKLYSILTMQCPKCQEYFLFKERLSNVYGIFEMHKDCSICGQEFELEPGFYWGAMFAAYGLSSGFMLISFVLMRFIIGYSMSISFISVSFLAILLIPVVFRLSRAMWINLYVQYDPYAINKKEKNG